MVVRLRAGVAEVYKALCDFAREHPGKALYPVRLIRARTDLSKSVFDHAALVLVRVGKANLHYHDAPSSLTPRERIDLVRDPKGKFYSGIALRDA